MEFDELGKDQLSDSTSLFKEKVFDGFQNIQNSNGVSGLVNQGGDPNSDVAPSSTLKSWMKSAYSNSVLKGSFVIDMEIVKVAQILMELMLLRKNVPNAEHKGRLFFMMESHDVFYPTVHLMLIALKYYL